MNSITLGFEFPIPHCADSIVDFSDLFDLFSIISLDARSGYHQISVWEYDQEKLVFSLLVEQKIRKQFHLSALQILQHFTLPRCSLYVKSSYFCLLIRSMSSVSIMTPFPLYEMTRLSLMRSYSTLTMSVHFFINFLVLLKFLQNMFCHLN